MNTDNHIDHAGFITAIRKGVAFVTLIQTSACASCAAKSACGVSGSEQKYFEIPVAEGQWRVGDEVIVRLNTSTGFLAVLLGYIFAFAIVVGTLMLSVWLGQPESKAGLLSLLVLVPYYAALALCGKWLRKKMHLKILKR